MTAEQVFKLYRAYKFFFDGRPIFKDGGVIYLTHPPFIQQHDRSYYYRLSVKLSDPAIHALFTLGFFFNPRAHVSDFMSPDALKKALAFGSRWENGETLLRHELYDLGRPYQEFDPENDTLMHGWLYGDPLGSMPEVLRQVITGTMPLDIAALLLLIPQPTLGYNWPEFWSAQPDIGLGPQPWIARLKIVDQLLKMQRPLWRLTAHTLATEFWASLAVHSLAPNTPIVDASLF